MIQYIPVTQIEYDERLNCSREITDDLLKSVTQFGVLEPLLCCRTDNGCIILSGHNRFSAALRSSMETVPVNVLQQFDYDCWVHCISRKVVCGTISHAGILKALAIVNDFIPEKAVAFSGFFCRGLEDQKKVLSVLIKYKRIYVFLNFKKAPLKFIVQLSGFDSIVLEFLEKMLGSYEFSLGNFRILAEYADEILRRDGTLPSELPKNGSESELISYYFHLRFPSFSKKKDGFEHLCSSIGKNGFKLNAPQNFEANYLELVYRIRVDEKAERFAERSAAVAAQIPGIKDFLSH